MPCRSADGPDLPQVRQAHRLAAAAVVRHRHHAERDALGPDLGDQRRRACARSRLPLNGWRLRGCVPSSMTRSTAVGPGVLDVGPRGVEVVVAGDDLARPADQLEQDPLAGPALVRRQDVRHAGQVAAAPSRSDTSSGPRRTTRRRGSCRPTARSLIADVPLSVSRSMITSSAGIWKRLKCACAQDRLALRRAWSA